jgi:hypothetical protein
MQEVKSHRVAVRPERRRQAEKEMQSLFDPAMQALCAALDHSGAQVLEAVLRAFAQWLNLTSANGVSGDTLRSSPLVVQAFEGLRDSKVFESAVDAVDELIWCTVSTNDCVPMIRSNMMPLVQA